MSGTEQQRRRSVCVDETTVCSRSLRTFNEENPMSVSVVAL